VEDIRLGRAHEAANELAEAEARFRAMHELTARWAAERLDTGLAATDPEDRETQVWLVHALLQYGRLEPDEEHFAKAEADFLRRAFDRLRRLDGEGKLEGRPAFKYRHMGAPRSGPAPGYAPTRSV
jgi:hypothetical protein